MGCVESSLSSPKPAIFLNGKVIEIVPKNCSHKQLQDQYRVSIATATSSSCSSSPSTTISPYVSLQPYSAESDHSATQHFIVKHRDLKKIERDNASSGGFSPNSIGPSSLSSLQDKSDKTKREKVAFSPLLSPHRSLDSRGGSGMGLILFDSSFENPNQSYTLFEHTATEDKLGKTTGQQQSSYSIACYSSQEKKHYFWSVQDGNRLSLIPSPASGQISDQEKFFFNVVASSPANIISPSPSSLAFTSSQHSSNLSSPQKSARGKEDEVESKHQHQQQQQRPSSAGSNLSTSSVDDPTTAKATLPHVLSERFPSDVEGESDDEEEEENHQTKGKQVENNNYKNSSSSSSSSTTTQSSTSSASNNNINKKSNSSFNSNCNSKYQDPMTQNLSTTPLGETSFL